MKNNLLPSSIADINALLKTPFLKNVTVLVSGKVAAQGIAVLAAPILTRLYDPTMFGFLGLFSSVAALCAAVATFRYDMAIVLPKEDHEAGDLVVISGAATILVAFASLIIISLFNAKIASLLDSPELAPFLFLVPLFVFFSGCNQIFQSWGTRRKWFKLLSVVSVVTATTTVTVKLLGGILDTGANGLIISVIVGQLAGTMWMALKVWQNDGKLILGDIKKENIKQFALKYYKFPKYSAPKILFNSISQQIPPLLFAGFFGPAVVGWYWFSKRLLNTPINLVGESVRRVFYQKASEKYNKGEDLYQAFLKATFILAAIASIPMLIIIVLGGHLFGFVFGEQWVEAGRYSQWLVVWLFFAFINRPSVAMLYVLGLQAFSLKLNVIFTVIRLIAILIGGYLSSPILAVMLYSISGAIFNIILISYIFCYLKKTSFNNNELKS